MMTAQRITLLPFEDAALIAYRDPEAEKLAPKRRAVIVCPGGAYIKRAAHEGEPVAMKFAAAGCAAFVLEYTVEKKAANYAPLCQLALAIKHVREHAEEYTVDPDYIFTCGFSAGGHLAASAGVLWDVPAVQTVLGDAPRGIGKPTGMVLCYPIITSEEPYINHGSFIRVCGNPTPTKEETDRFSLEKHVDATTPPAFFWHTFADTGVPMENSLLLAAALRKYGTPFELHIFPEGAHGLGLCDGTKGDPLPHNACWIDLAIRWVLDLKV